MNTYSDVMSRLLARDDPLLNNLVNRITGLVNHHLKRGHIGLEFIVALSAYLDSGLRFYLEKRQTDVRADMVLRSVVAYLRVNLKGGLALRNFHQRDFNISFFDEGHRYELLEHDEAAHSYTAKSNRSRTPGAPPDLTSVTALIGELMPKFDQEAEIDRMMADTERWNDPVRNKRYFGMTRQAVLDLWVEIGEDASEEGTAMHANIEAYYNGFEYDATTPEFKLFEYYEKQYVTDLLVPYRTEWLVHNKALQLTGSIDMLYAYVEGCGRSSLPDANGKIHLVLADWKRSKRVHYKSFPRDGQPQYGCQPCTAQVENCNYRKYGIQLQLYKYMLEAEYDIIIDEMWMVVLHPNNSAWLPIRPNPTLIDSIVQHRIAVVEEQRLQRMRLVAGGGW